MNQAHPTRPAFLRGIRLERQRVPSFDAYPFHLPPIRSLREVSLDPAVTFLVGENGTGKSTLLEAVAVAWGLNAEGGSRNFNFSTRRSHSALCDYLTLVRGTARPRDGYFLRAESLYTVATEIERLDEGGGGRKVIDGYGGRSLHEQSHGEAFLALLMHRFRSEGLYLLDEPEAALSPQRQLAMLRRIYDLAGMGSQFIIATHSPILLAYPKALIYLFSDKGLTPITYEETDHYRTARAFLSDPGRTVALLFED